MAPGAWPLAYGRLPGPGTARHLLVGSSQSPPRPGGPTDRDRLFLDDSISPPDDTLAGVATSRHVVRPPHGSRLERWIASQQQRDGEVLHIRSLTATGWLESTLKLDQDGVVAAAHRLIVANALWSSSLLVVDES